MNNSNPYEGVTLSTPSPETVERFKALWSTPEAVERAREAHRQFVSDISRSLHYFSIFEEEDNSPPNTYYIKIEYK